MSGWCFVMIGYASKCVDFCNKTEWTFFVCLLVFRSYHSCKENACITRLGELSCEVRLEQRTTKGSSSGRIMRLEPVFILEKHNQSKYKVIAQVRPFSACIKGNRRSLQAGKCEYGQYRSSFHIWRIFIHRTLVIGTASNLAAFITPSHLYFTYSNVRAEKKSF